MKLYHYAPLKNTVLTKGLNSFAGGYGDIIPYTDRAQSNSREEIISWMEKTFPGRSRSVSVITEPICWKGNDLMLKEFVETHTLFSVALDNLLEDNLVESIWCQDGEKLYPIQPAEIELSPLSWGKCSRDKGLFFGAIRHYFIVLKDGVIPPQYIRQEKI